MSDLAVHTLMAVGDYASEYTKNLIENKGKNLDNSEPVPLSSLGRL